MLGALGDLAWTPRLEIDGFVVAPASWRVPPPIATGRASARHLREWRRRAGLPRFVQVGVEDELLPVDLAAPLAVSDLLGQSRIFEIWPPLGDTPDRSGRRVEAVVALADDPQPEERAVISAAVAGTSKAGPVPPPRALRLADTLGWRTYKLFGIAERQDALLAGLVAPVVRQARAAGEISAWFFLRYVEGPGRRAHLRLRARFPKAGDARFVRRLNRAAVEAMEAGDLVAIEHAPYFAELARFGGPGAMGAVHALFEADSEMACALLTAELRTDDSETDRASSSGALTREHHDDLESPALRLLCLVAAFESLARGLGLDAEARRALAQRRAHAHSFDLDVEATRELGRSYRSVAQPLRRFLSGALPPELASALGAYRERVQEATAPLDDKARAQILAPLLHLTAVRLVGLDRFAEIRGYALWARALESLARHPVAASPPQGA
jgi:thiopeptide-type bacteriocin biosynthesis protein